MRYAKSPIQAEISGPPDTADVRSTEERTFSCGSRKPKLPQNSRDHAPLAMIALSHATRPRSVTTPVTRPPVRSSPRTAQFSTITAPAARAALASAGTAFCGSARPSVLV